MAATKDTVSYIGLRNDIIRKHFQPIYVLEGEESYFINQLADLIIANALTPDEQSFNLTVTYGVDANVREVISTCKRYPIMSKYQVVAIREAQNMAKQPGHSKDLDLFKFYAENPLKSTILIICNTGGSIKAPELVKTLKKTGNGVVFVSNKLRDRDIVPLTKQYVTSKKMNIDDKSARMMADYVGTDVSRLFGELDKLALLSGDTQRITPELIEKNIGISKDYNNYELEDAISNRNAGKAFRILDYFERNPKNNPVEVTVGMLFSFFTSVLLVRTARDKSTQNLLKVVGTRSEWRLRKFMDATRMYSTAACVNAIGYLRECDTKTKGLNSHQDRYALIQEMCYKILHS